MSCAIKSMKLIENQWFSYFKEQIYNIISDLNDDNNMNVNMNNNILDKIEKSLLLSNHINLETFDEIINRLEITNSDIDLFLDINYDNVLYQSDLKYNPLFFIKYFNNFRANMYSIFSKTPCIEEVIKIGAPFDVRQNISYIALNHNVSFEFLVSYIEKGWLLPNQIGLRHPGMNWDFVKLHYDYFKDLDIGRVHLFSTLDFITPEIVREHPDFKWNLYGLIANKNMTFEFIKTFSNQFNQYHINDLICQPYVTLNDIQNNPEIKWDFNYIFKNPNITTEYIEANLGMINTIDKIINLVNNRKLTADNFIKIYNNFDETIKYMLMSNVNLNLDNLKEYGFTFDFMVSNIGLYKCYYILFEKFEMSEDDVMKYITYSRNNEDKFSGSVADINTNFNLFWKNKNIPLSVIDKLLDKYSGIDIYYYENVFYEYRTDLTFEFVKKQLKRLYKTTYNNHNHNYNYQLFNISRYIYYDFEFEKQNFILKKAREHMAAFKIQNLFRECLLCPFHPIGIRKINRDYNFMTSRNH